MAECVCCKGWTDSSFRSPKLTDPIPVCDQCARPAEDGRVDPDSKFAQWLRDVDAEIRSAGIQFVSTGNLLKNLEIVRSYLRQSSRIEDGVCPNGCAILETPEPGRSVCPVCKFEGYNLPTPKPYADL